MEMINEMSDRENLVWVGMECALCKVDLSGWVFERFYYDIKTNPNNKWINGKLQDSCFPCNDMKKRNSWIEKEIERMNNDIKIKPEERIKRIIELSSKKNKRVVIREHVISTLQLHGFDIVKKRFKDYEYKAFIDQYIKNHSQNYREYLIRLGLGEYMELLEMQE